MYYYHYFTYFSWYVVLWEGRGLDFKLIMEAKASYGLIHNICCILNDATFLCCFIPGPGFFLMTAIWGLRWYFSINYCLASTENQLVAWLPSRLKLFLYRAVSFRIFCKIVTVYLYFFHKSILANSEDKKLRRMLR